MVVKKKNDDDDKIVLAVLTKDIDYIKQKIDDVDEKLERDYVTCEKYNYLERRVQLLEKINFGLITLIVVAVITSLIKLVVFP